VTESGTGTWDGDVGLRTRGRGTSELGDAARRAGTQGRDKQTTPDFCAEFEKYNFWLSSVR